MMNTKRLFFYNLIVFFLPATKFFTFKSKLLCWCGAKIGENVRIVSSARFQISGLLEIGDNTWIGHEVLIVGGNSKVSIGNNCDIAPRVLIATGSHKLNKITDSKIAGKGYSKDIIIGNGCWICAGANILGGTTIGEKSIVAAGGVCRGTLKAGAVYGGVPIKLIKMLD